MADSNYIVAITGQESLDYFENFPDKARTSAIRAINATAARARTDAARKMREQVNFPAAYIQPAGGRLIVAQKAQGSDLQAIVSGRSRPTMLARFATPTVGGARVEVQPGLARLLPRAFFINLRVGNDPQDPRSNRGLAIRLPQGQVPSRAYKPSKIGRGLWLLFGPSVDQAFKAIADELSPGAADYLEAEFLRLMDLKL